MTLEKAEIIQSEDHDIESTFYASDGKDCKKISIMK